MYLIVGRKEAKVKYYSLKHTFVYQIDEGWICAVYRGAKKMVELNKNQIKKKKIASQN